MSVVRVGCDARTQVVIIDGRYIRWRCTHHHCPDAVAGQRRGAKVYHVFDMVTGERWAETDDVEDGAEAA